jgi:hypothetical protein
MKKVVKLKTYTRVTCVNQFAYHLGRWSLNNLLWGSFVFNISSQIFVNACLLDQSAAASGPMQVFGYS